MNTQQELDKWIIACQKYYNLNSKNKTSMQTLEEKVQQLQTAHGRLFNNHNTLHQDFVNYRQVMNEELNLLKEMIKSLQPKEDNSVRPLPDEMEQGQEYVAIISEVIKRKNTKWNNMDWTNWQIKLEGKEEHYIAFIPTEYTLQIGDKVRFQYAAPFQCKKLKQIK